MLLAATVLANACGASGNSASSGEPTQATTDDATPQTNIEDDQTPEPTASDTTEADTENESAETTDDETTDADTENESADPTDSEAPDATANADEAVIETTADGCDSVLAAFASQPQVNARCDGEWLRFDGTGLAQVDPEADDLAMMVGITAWILRVPIPFDYAWQIPSEPEWTGEIVEANPKGPIAIAIDGVPIFHYEARPDGSTALAAYDARSDTVVAGELDHCGGHAGQGEDYHYHYAPVCLIDGHDPTEPIAFGLDGAPIYIGTAGDDYYGLGAFNDVDFSPTEALDDCNAIQLEDGSWVHYTTTEPPYVIGCHHAAVDSSLQIEPSPMREQRSASPYGGQVGEPIDTVITAWYVDEDGWMHLEHTSFDGQGTSAIVYRAADGDDCWDFEFREDSEMPGIFETYCRPVR